MKNKIPDRWEAYKPMGRQIPGTRFICFKVPLREAIVQRAVNNGAAWFCPRTLMDHCHNLGLIIDLTNTDRYYHSSVFTSQGIGHAKIATMGKVIPNSKVVKRFFQLVNNFLEENKENEKLIGVHCTHGLNRTGYLVCRYMIQHLGVPPDQAISDFNSARGHEQERQEYLYHLRQMQWLQEPSAVSNDSEKEEEEEEAVAVVKNETPPDNRRRSKRNYDDIRNEDDDDDAWTSGPARKWPRTPHTERRHYEQYGKYSRTPNQGFHNRSSEKKRHKVQTSPYGGQQYYDNYYQGRAAPQYDFNFYQQQGSGLGPYRNSPKWSKNVHWGNNSSRGRPRQYQGPRQYATPKRERETLNNNESFSEGTSYSYGRRRNPFSPGTSSNVFSPEESVSTKRRNPFSPESSETPSRKYHRKRKEVIPGF